MLLFPYQFLLYIWPYKFSASFIQFFLFVLHFHSLNWKQFWKTIQKLLLIVRNYQHITFIFIAIGIKSQKASFDCLCLNAHVPTCTPNSAVYSGSTALLKLCSDCAAQPFNALRRDIYNPPMDHLASCPHPYQIQTSA